MLIREGDDRIDLLEPAPAHVERIPWSRDVRYDQIERSRTGHHPRYEVLEHMRCVCDCREHRLSALWLAAGLSIAVALGYVSARCGLWWGNWMARVQR